VSQHAAYPFLDNLAISCKLYLSRKILIKRIKAETTPKYKQLVAYVWLETADGRVISYTRGKYSAGHRTLLLGKRSVGFGGHVLKEDARGIFGSQDAGLSEAARREIAEELKGRQVDNLVPQGVIWDDSSYEGQKHVGVVFKGQLLKSAELQSIATELSINKVTLNSKEKLWDEYHNMEFWSQLLLREFAGPAPFANLSKIVPTRRPRKIKYIALVGEIASGKSSISNALQGILGYSVISASSCLQELLSFGNLRDENRLDFSSASLEFIEDGEGPIKLASEIAQRALSSSGDVVIIDGIRQLSTLHALRSRLSELIVVYVDCPRDLAFENYKARWPGADILTFAAVREHRVEADLPEFRYAADAILHNADCLVKTISLFVEWLQE